MRAINRVNPMQKAFLWKLFTFWLWRLRSAKTRKWSWCSNDDFDQFSWSPRKREKENVISLYAWHLKHLFQTERLCSIWCRLCGQNQLLQSSLRNVHVRCMTLASLRRRAAHEAVCGNARKRRLSRYKVNTDRLICAINMSSYIRCHTLY